jgi:integrase
MGRPRKDRLDLPERVYFRHGAYYFAVDKKWIRLGSDYKEAMTKWSEMLEHTGKPVATVNDLFDRYALEVLPGKSVRSQSDNRQEMRFLRTFFGRMQVTDVKPKHIAEYVDARKAKTRANREVALLSHAFNKAILWGIASVNPCSVPGLRNTEVPRNRYVTDEEVEHFKQWCPAWLKLYIDLKLLLALRKQDMLSLEWLNMDEKFIHVKTMKTGQQIAVVRTPELNALLDQFSKEPGSLFKTRSGKPYTTEGFDSTWQRVRLKYTADKGESFHEHDLRGKVATDMNNPEAAKELLAHKSITMTESYIKSRKINVVQPATRRKKNELEKD